MPADEINIFYGKTASFYGDSLTEENYHYTKGYHQWVKEILGLESYSNHGKSGNKISDVYNKVNSVNDTADIIFIMCGVNDQTYSVPIGVIGDNTTDTTYGALNLLCALLKQKYPTKIVVFITPHYQTKYPHSEGVTSYEVSKAVREVCGKYAIPIYDNFVLSGIYSTNLSTFTTDNCHWNNSAHEMVGKNLAQFMLNTFRYIHSNSVTMMTGMEITGFQFENQYHISLYVTADDLPAITNESPMFGFTMKPLTDFVPNCIRTGGMYMVAKVNDLSAGYTDVPYDNHDAIANIVNNGDGTYSVTMVQNVVSHNADRAFWCFPINMSLVVGNKFNITNAFVYVGDKQYPIHAIGGAFVGETFTTDKTE